MPRTVIHFTDSSGFGGAEVALLTLLGGLDRRQWRPVLFHHESLGLKPLLEETARIGIRTRPIAHARGLPDLPRLRREVRSENASVFHAHLSWALRCDWGLLAADLAGVPAVIATQQLYRPISSPREILRQRLIGGRVDRYIAVSESMARSLRETPLFPARKVVVIRNAVDPARFEKERDGALRRALGLPDRPIALALARLDPQKGLSDLLEAAALVPDASFVVAGDGPERKRLQDIAGTLGIDDRVLFLGHRQDVPELLAACDLFVLPSLYEGLPLSVLEAMAAGRPVIATAIGGTDEAVTNGETGLLVPPGNPPALAAAIRSVLSDPDLARRMGLAGRQRAVREFSAEKMVSEVTRLYETVLSGRPAGSPESRPAAEDTRNRLLRRTDWRFLLPGPQPASTLCFSEDLLEPLRLISRVTEPPPPGEASSGFELAVASDPSPATLEAARSALVAGGSLYTEWRARVHGGWRAVASKLRLAGFEDPACFWPRPDPSLAPATVWIPLETREPLDYYRTHRRRTRNPLRLAGRAARRIQWMLRPRRPVSAVARKPADSATLPRTGESDRLMEAIRENWSDWGLGPAPRKIFRLLQAMPGRSSGKVLVFLFAEGDAAPRLVAKTARTPESAAGLLREADVLRALEARPRGVAGVPRILLSHPDGLVVETVLPGLPLSGYLTRRSYASLAEKGASWLADLAGPDDGPREPCGGFVDRVLADFVSRFGSAVDPGLLRDVEGLLAQLPPLRPTCEQRDFSPWNVLVAEDGSLSVLDWESSELHGLPGLDLIYFLTYLAFYFDHALRTGRHRDSFRRTLDAATLTGRVAKRCLDGYCERTNLPKEAIRPLRVLAWLLHSRSEYRHLVEDAGGTPDRDRLRRSFFLDLLSEELRGF